MICGDHDDYEIGTRKVKNFLLQNFKLIKTIQLPYKKNVETDYYNPLINVWERLFCK